MVLPHATAALSPSFPSSKHSASSAADRDDLTRSDAVSYHGSALCCFSVHAMLDPGLLPRLLQLIAKRGLMPDAMHAVQAVSEQGDAEYVVDLKLADVPAMTGELMAESMRQIPGVSYVYFTALAVHNAVAAE